MLSYLLKIPLHVSFTATEMNTVQCLTMNEEAFNRLLGIGMR
jgi:hypothetical protein